MAHARLRREMDDLGESAVAEERRRSGSVGQVDAREAELRMRREPREPRLLQRDVVVRVEIVDARHRARRRRAARAATCMPMKPAAPVTSTRRDGRGSAHRRGSAVSARSFAYLRKLANAPIAMCTKPATPSRKPSLST